MDTIRWDAMAALIALIGLPLMLSGSATWLIKFTINRIQRFVLTHGATCERLEWQDIPDGPLRDGDTQGQQRTRKPPWRFMHSEKECFNSSLGRVFHYAWISAQRRNQHVFKPYQLDPTKHYLRTDPKTLEAFLILSHTSVIQFHDANGILTAHLPVIDSRSNSRVGQLHNRTKHEVEMILRGYPPFYVEKIKITDTISVSSPIVSMDDITRGGWILGVGLDSLSTPPFSTHNMEGGYFPPSTWKVQYPSPLARDGWKFSCMSYAINRFGEVLSKALALSPDMTATKSALEVFRGLTTGTIDTSVLYSTCYSDIFEGHPEFHELDSHVGGYIHPVGRLLPPLTCRSKLNANEWQLAMSAFNHGGPLESNEIELFNDKMLPILQAAMLGLVCVFTFGHYRSMSRLYEKLPTYTELQGIKYIYLTPCDQESGNWRSAVYSS